MFVRNKKNKSGIISVQIIDKSSGKYRVYRTVGSSSQAAEAKRLYQEARKEIERISRQQQLPFEFEREKELVDVFFHGIEDCELPCGRDRRASKYKTEYQKQYNKIQIHFALRATAFHPCGRDHREFMPIPLN